VNLINWHFCDHSEWSQKCQIRRVRHGEEQSAIFTGRQ